jgi:hypothetical protein
MATQQDQLIQAIRRIAKSDPEIRSLLTVLQKRGALDGLVKLVGGSDAAALEDCCTKDDDAEPEDAEPEDISEDAPPEVPDIGDDDGDGQSEWSDCGTGDPITFSPGGFPQPETCKGECVPDPEWVKGFYGAASFGDYITKKPTLGAAQSELTNHLSSAYSVPFYLCGKVGSNGACETYNVCYDNNGTDNPVGTANVCSVTCTPQDSVEYCTHTAPEICDQPWESDNTTSYTLANGCIVASTCDPDASAASQACNECITICNAEGQERRVCAIGNGQWILYDPNGEYKGGRYDATGRRLEVLDKGETGGYLPSEAYDGSYDGGTIGGGDGWVWS